MGELFERICARETLEGAWRQVLQKNARGGLDGIQPGDLETEISKTICRLSEDLPAKRYVPVPYARGAMPKFNEENEWRSLSLPAVVDKIVQQAFIEVIGPVFEKEFLDCSYAYRRGKGPVKAIQRIEHILGSYSIRWVATMDIDNFFDTMDHGLLVNEISKKIHEPEVLNLVSLWIHAGIINSRGGWDEPDEGIAQGSLCKASHNDPYAKKVIMRSNPLKC